jgi:putative flippase GtrA
MFSSRAKPALLLRFLAGGAFNTAFGFAVILLMMQTRLPPLVANAGGYAAGLLLSFAVNRQFVFRAYGAVPQELRRYAAAFLVSYAANAVVLEALARSTSINPYAAQVAAVGTYVVLMFLLCQTLVFRQRKKDL